MRQWIGWLSDRLRARETESPTDASGTTPLPEFMPELPLEESEERAMIKPLPLSKRPAQLLRLAWKTDVGQLRNHNEDTLVVFLGQQEGMVPLVSFGLCIVADGMGGHQAGELASALASRVVASYLLEHVYLPLLQEDAQEPESDALAEVVRTAIAQANEAVIGTFPGSGTTLTSALLLGAHLLIGHVGDSRAYLLRPEDGLQQLTADHSLVYRLVEMGQLSPEEAGVHPQRNVLYQAVGQGAPLQVDVIAQTLQPGERVLLCSDGLWEMVNDATIQRLVEESPSIQAACESLVVAANEAGGTDNITVMMAELADS